MSNSNTQGSRLSPAEEALCQLVARIIRRVMTEAEAKAPASVLPNTRPDDEALMNYDHNSIMVGDLVSQ